MEKEGDLSEFECVMVVGARWTSLSTSQTANLAGFFHTFPSLGFAENCLKKWKYPGRGSSQKRLADVRWEWPDGFELRGSSNNHSLQAKHAEEHLRPHQVALLTAKNSKMRLKFTKIGQDSSCLVSTVVHLFITTISNHVKLASWTQQWIHCIQMVSSQQILNQELCIMDMQLTADCHFNMDQNV